MAVTTRIYDRSKIQEFLEMACAKIGADRFSILTLLELEKAIRVHDLKRELPGKTLLREEIHTFRSKKWPAHRKPSWERR